MQTYDVYSDIAQRTGGDVYLGVVGPVRTGKSTFIKRFMEQLVLPSMENEYDKKRALDETPQTGAGRTIMTTQPHFVPNEAAVVRFGENADVQIRLIDCVGYMVPGAMGMLEDEAPRMVRTPWFDEDIPFEAAAEIGTKKVITDHSTIGVVMTTDGTVTGIPRDDYVVAEERVIADVKAQGKPFIVILNTVDAQSDDARALGAELSEKYGVGVRVMNVLEMDEADIEDVLDDLLLEFPISRVDIDLPQWARTLPVDHELIAEILRQLNDASADAHKMRDLRAIAQSFNTSDARGTFAVDRLELGSGCAQCRIELDPALFYEILSDKSGLSIDSDGKLMTMICDLAAAKREYDRLHDALESAKTLGYGFVYPQMEQMKLEDPEIVRQGGRFGVSLKASAPALLISRIDIETEVSPVMGTEKQREELVDYLTAEFQSDPARMWNTNVFGKSLNELVQEGLNNKLSRMPADVQKKMTETMRRIINDGRGGVICVLL